MIRRLSLILASLLVAPSMFGLSVGSLTPGAHVFIGTSAAPYTFVNGGEPASSSGSLTTATIMWESTGGAVPSCASAFKVKLLRPAVNPFGFTVIADRGPFNAVRGVNTVVLSPPVTVQSGDVLGVTLLKPLDGCGTVQHVYVSQTEMLFFSKTDPASGNLGSLNAFRGMRMCARASSDAAVLQGTIPVVGSTAGAAGSQFRTGVQLSNIDDFASQGRLVFHPAGRSGLDGDPSVTFQLAAGQTLSIPDVVASSGATGLGSLDLVMTSGPPPNVTARIFNDAGINGTAGFTEEVQIPDQAVREGNYATLTIPADLTNLRLNIGVRTLDAGATMTLAAFNAAGVKVASTTKTYGPNFFEQVTAAQFINAANVPPGGTISVYFNSGSAFLYGAITDNKTNDPAVRFFTRY